MIVVSNTRVIENGCQGFVSLQVSSLREASTIENNPAKGHRDTRSLARIVAVDQQRGNDEEFIDVIEPIEWEERCLSWTN